MSGAFRLLLMAFGSLYPKRLAFGFALGFIAKMALDAWARSYPEIVFLSALNNWHTGYYVFICSVIPFAPIIFFRGNLPERVVQQIATLDALLHKQGANQKQRKEAWQTLIKIYLNSTEPSTLSDQSIQDIAAEISKQFPDQTAPTG